MNNLFIKNTFLFIILVLLQVLIFNHIGYLGYIHPMVYLIFILIFPYREERIPFLFAAFLIGLWVDIFSNTGGIHAASSVFVAYIRSRIIRIVFGQNFEYQEIKLPTLPFAKVFSYTTIIVVLHHTLFYFLEVFNFNHLFTTILKIGTASASTIAVCLLSIYIFSPQKK
ncbi:MAG: rod shape-determining protein MreD [Capnocytophaga sp.]|nr:rod shape-determining protein MreD [Capnocytophaga sp.]